MPTPPEAPEAPTVVLVAGAGRSGTSTIAGVLARLGAHVPEPVLAANQSNPRGFYESWWPVRFHRRLMKRADIEQTDGRPVAGSLMAAAVDEEARARLRAWLSEQLVGHDLVLVKDPRAAWVPTLWTDTVTDLGAQAGCVIMLRHPSEVIGSRSTYYASNRPGMSPREFAIWNLCGWINQNLTMERRTRDQRRALVRYTDLLADWRAALTGLLDGLGLGPELLTPAAAAAIDDFVEPGLRRHAVDWGELDLPAYLIDVAEQTWTALCALADRSGHDSPTEQTLDEIGERYASLYAAAQAIAHDHASARARKALRKGRLEGRRTAEQARAEQARARRLPARARRAAAAVVRRLRPGRPS